MDAAGGADPHGVVGRVEMQRTDIDVLSDVEGLEDDRLGVLGARGEAGGEQG